MPIILNDPFLKEHLQRPNRTRDKNKIKSRHVEGRREERERKRKTVKPSGTQATLYEHKKERDERLTVRNRQTSPKGRKKEPIYDDPADLDFNDKLTIDFV